MAAKLYRIVILAGLCWGMFLAVPALSEDTATKLPPETEESLRFFFLKIHLQGAEMAMECWLMGCKEYKGASGRGKLAIATGKERDEAMKMIKEEIDYRKESPAIVQLLKEAMTITIEYFDTLAPQGMETKSQHQARLDAMQERLANVVAKIETEIELSK